MYTSFVLLVRRCRCYQTDCTWEETEVAEDDEEEDEESDLRLICEWYKREERIFWTKNQVQDEYEERKLKGC